MSRYYVEYEDYPSCYDPYVERRSGIIIVTARNMEDAKDKVKGPNRRVTAVTEIIE